MSTPPERSIIPDIRNMDTSSSGLSAKNNRLITPDGAEYPRKRATVACHICRLRKTRCNGARPKCQLCNDLGVNCVYREPGIKLDAGDQLILGRLDRIEELLQSSLPGKTTLFNHPSTSPMASNDSNLGSDDAPYKAPCPNDLPKRKGIFGQESWTNLPASISTMPRLHTTPALHLLQWPRIRDLVSGPYNSQSLLQLEMAREPLRLPPTRDIDLSNAATYVKAFFQQANIWYACVNPHTWTHYYNTAVSVDFQEGPESCVVLLVLALGSASNDGSISFIPLGIEASGFAYFAAAWHLLPFVMMRNSVLATQCIVLASAYLFYLVRPLEAWMLLSNASMKLQLLFGHPNRVPLRWKELSIRLYWNTLLYESDLLAELDLPHSGIVYFEELVDLPGGFEEECDEDDEDSSYNARDDNNRKGNLLPIPVGRDELWYFLAEIALRRLLNRVSHLIYQKDSPLSLKALSPIVAELDFQLSQWYENLPKSIQFPLTPEAISDPVQMVLRLRYFACRTIIYRPYIQAVLENEQEVMDPTVREYCRRCLEATLRQLENITNHREGHLPYLWQGALSMVSQTLLIMGMTMSPALCELLPPFLVVDKIISGVVMETDRYKHLAPSLKLSAEIIRDADKRRQAHLTSMGKHG